MSSSVRFIAVCSVAILALSTDAQIPTAGLIAWYPFAGDAFDMSGHGYDATVTGPTLTQDRFDRDSNAYAFAPPPGGYQGIMASIGKYGTMSVSIWYRIPGTPSNTPPLFDYPDSANLLGNMSCHIAGTNFGSGVTPGTLVGGTSWRLRSKYPVSFGAWHHVVFVRDTLADSLRLYIDGSRDTAIANGAAAGRRSGEIWFGRIAYNVLGRPLAQWAFTGALDDIRIYNRVLSGSEVAALYAESPPPSAPTLTSPLDGATGLGINPILSWSAVSGAASYTIQVCTTATCATPTVDDTGYVPTSYLVASALANGTLHYWRVRARNSGGDGAWSETWSFTTEPGVTVREPRSLRSPYLAPVSAQIRTFTIDGRQICADALHSFSRQHTKRLIVVETDMHQLKIVPTMN